MGDRNRGDGKPYGGFYTQADLREVVAHASKLHITVLPEIEMPGHAAAAIAAYPELGNSDIPDYAPKVKTSWGVHPYTFAPKEETFQFIPDNFTPEEAKRVLGCQAQHWSEYLFNWSKVEFMAFPRTCALAEVAWSPKEGKDRGEFEGRLDIHLKRFDALMSFSMA